MECGKQNIKIVEGNAFALILPLKQRTFVASTPIDEDIVYADLQDVVLKIGDTQFTATLEAYGVQVLVPYDALTRGTYDILLTATYHGSEIRASYFEALTIVKYNSQSDAQQYIAGSPIVLDAAYVIGGTLTDAELEALKEEYREKNAQLQQAIEDAEAAKAEWEQKAADLDGVAQESTSQEILTAVENIDIDTSDLAKEATLGTPLAGQPSTIFAAIAQSGQDSKQTIANAINQMGGSATADMTWAQLAQEIQNLPQDIFDPRVKFQDTLQRPIDMLGILINHLNGVEAFYTDVSGNVDLVRCVGRSNSTIKKFHAPNITTIPTNSSATNPVGVGVIEVFMESLTAIPPYFLWSYPPIRKLYCPNVSSVSSDSMHTANLIDFYIGGAFISSINLSGSKYNPTEAYRTDISNLCFDTDLEEYGQLFSTNWDKWKWCIINHFAANVPDRTGLTAYTITFGSTVLSHFDAEMIASFTDKNWTLA